MLKYFKIQQNPVVYVFLGVSQEIREGIIKSQSTSAWNAGVGYIQDFSDNELNRIQLEFIKKEYRTRGTIRINFILSPENKESELLFNIIDKIDEKMSKFYPGGIIIDIYVILDEHKEKLPNEIAQLLKTFTSLRSIKDNVNIIYILSNVSSRGFFHSNNTLNIIKSISKVWLIKDTVSEMHHGTVYDERYFYEGANHYNGDFFTIGYNYVKIPEDEIVEIITRKIINDKLSQSRENKSLTAQIVWKYILVSKINLPKVAALLRLENIIGIAAKKIQNYKCIKDKLNYEVIDMFFGQRLQCYFDLNIKSDLEKSILTKDDVLDNLNNLIRDKIVSFIDMYNCITQVILLLEKQLALINSDILSAEKELENWLNDKAYINANHFIHQYEFPYMVAQQFMRLKLDIINQTLLKKELLCIKSALNTFYIQIKLSYDNLIAQLDECYLQVNRQLQLNSKLSSIYLEEYYEMEAEKYKDESLDIATMDAIKYYSYIKNFVSNNILPNFKNMRADQELIQRLGGVGKIQYSNIIPFIIDTIFSEKNYNLNIKSEHKNKHEHTTLIIDSSSSIVDYLKTSGYRIGVHLEENKRDMEIIYQMGTYKIEELYYAQLYGL